MANSAVFMGPSAGVSVVGLIFCMVAAISYSSDYSTVKNTHVLKYTVEPKDTAQDKTEYYFGLSHQANLQKDPTTNEEKEISCPFKKDPLCEYEKENADDDCAEKEVADSCKDDCEEKCKLHPEGEQRDKCEENCNDDLKNHRAYKFGFSAAILGVVFFLVLAILSGLRIGALNSLPIKIVGIVFSFLAFVFLLSGFAVLLAHPKKSYERRYIDESSRCTDQDASELNGQTASTATADCEISMGPAVILMIVAWIFTLVPLICHAICPNKAANEFKGDVAKSNLDAV